MPFKEVFVCTISVIFFVFIVSSEDDGGFTENALRTVDRVIASYHLQVTIMMIVVAVVVFHHYCLHSPILYPGMTRMITFFCSIKGER